MKGSRVSPSTRGAVAVFGVLVLNLAFQPWLEEKLFEWSLEHMLENHEHSIWLEVATYFEWPGRTFVSKSLSIGLLVFGLPQEAWFLVTCSMSSEALDRLLKLYYGVYRPFFYKDGMRNCRQGFANPSGHNQAAATFLTTAWLCFNLLFAKKAGKAVSYGLACLFALLLFLQSLERLYTQKHTADQLVFGAVNGFCVSYLFWHLLYLKYLQQPLRQITQESEKKSLITRLTLYFILFFTMTTLACYFSFLKYPRTQEYFEKLANCQDTEKASGASYANQTYYFGLFIQPLQLFIIYYYMRIQNQELLKRKLSLKHKLILSSLFLGFMGLSMGQTFISFFVPLKHHDWKKYVFGILLPCLLTDPLIYYAYNRALTKYAKPLKQE